MFCNNCGKEIPDGSKFCLECGTPVSLPEPEPAIEPEPAPEPAPEPEPAPACSSKWPPVIGILMLIAFAVFCVGFVFYVKYVVAANGGADVKGTILAVTMQTVPWIWMIAAPILFFVRTRRRPFITAIPRILCAGWSVVTTAISLVTYLNSSHSATYFVSTQIASLLVSMLPVVLYLLAVFIKPKTAVIAILHLIVSLLLVFLSFLSANFNTLLRESTAFRYYGLFLILGYVSSLFSAMGYSIACFLIRRKYYPEKN